MPFERKCPSCGKIHFYTEKSNLLRAIRKKTLCHHCAAPKGNLSHLYGKNQSGPNNPMFGKHFTHSEVTRQKISENQRGEKGNRWGKTPWNKGLTKYTDERVKIYVDKISKIRKKLYDEGKLKPWNKGLTKEIDARLKHVGDLARNRLVTENAKQNMHAARINYMNKCSIFFPNYNIDACKLFKNINRAYGFNGQHAENGGERYVKELGRWLDFYDEKENLVIEYYEREHYIRTGQLNDRTMRRESAIIDFLNCSFIRINAFDKNNLKYEPVILHQNVVCHLMNMNVICLKGFL